MAWESRGYEATQKPPLCKGRDALSKRSSGPFVAKAGRGATLDGGAAAAATEGLI